MNYYNRHLGDYMRDTGHLTLLEHGVYCTLLDWQYGCEKPLPDDMEVIYRFCRATSKLEKMAVQRVKNEFFLEDGWNKRAKAEIEGFTRTVLEKRIGALKRHHPELKALPDEQVLQWCMTHGYALDQQCRTSNTRARSNPHTPIPIPHSIEGGEGVAHFPESVSDDAVIAFGKKYPGEPATGTPGPMASSWVTEFLSKINGRREWPRDWQRYMVACWRKEWRHFNVSGSKPSSGNSSEKNGGAVSANVEAIEKARRRKELQQELDELQQQIEPIYRAGAEIPRELRQRELELQEELLK